MPLGTLDVWMPVSGWNARLQGVRGGGLAGVIVYSALAPAIRTGYASVSTDPGHVSRPGLRNPFLAALPRFR